MFADELNIGGEGLLRQSWKGVRLDAFEYSAVFDEASGLGIYVWLRFRTETLPTFLVQWV